jgi:hypothetical protein
MANTLNSETMEAEDIARSLMKEIMYDNGWVNAITPEETYPALWVGLIRDAVQNILTLNINFEFTKEVIKDIAVGGRDEDVIRKYNRLAGYTILDFLLNQYFDNDYEEIETRNERGL